MNLDQMRAELKAIKYKTDLIGAVDYDAIQKKLRKAKDDGDLLAAIDHCRAAADAAPDEAVREKMRIEEVILLARIASLEEAVEKYDQYRLTESAARDARSLKARIFKDQAFVTSGEERVALMKQSYARYRAVLNGVEAGWDQGGYEFNGINVATLSYLLREETGDRSWWDETDDIRTTLRAFTPEPNFWSLATRAELELIEGRDDEAAAILRALVGAADDAAEEVLRRILGLATTAPPPEISVSPSDMISTQTQLRRIKATSAAARALRGGPCLHFSGHMIRPPGAETGRFLAQHEAAVAKLIRERLENIAPSAVYGSLASGVDILVLEAVRAMNVGRKDPIEINLFLPFGLEDFYRESIKSAEGDWGKRAHTILQDKKINGPRYLSEDRALTDDPLAFGLTSRHAMGTTILEAGRTGRVAAQLVAWDGEPATGPAGAAADLDAWPEDEEDRFESHQIDLAPFGAKAADAGGWAPPAPTLYKSRDQRALVFGDVKNFSKLSEEQLPLFVKEVLGAVKRSLAVGNKGGDQDAEALLDFSNTWGDGVFAVYRTASAAALFALDLQDRMAKVQKRMARRAKQGELSLPPDLAIRLGMHFGAAYRVREPVTGRDNYFGEAVARAARIEPITREGRIFVSEEFASELALDADSPADAEYVGERDAAKNYGRLRLYRIRPKTP